MTTENKLKSFKEFNENNLNENRLTDMTSEDEKMFISELNKFIPKKYKSSKGKIVKGGRSNSIEFVMKVPGEFDDLFKSCKISVEQLRNEGEDIKFGVLNYEYQHHNSSNGYRVGLVILEKGKIRIKYS